MKKAVVIFVASIFGLTAAGCVSKPKPGVVIDDRLVNKIEMADQQLYIDNFKSDDNKVASYLANVSTPYIECAVTGVDILYDENNKITEDAILAVVESVCKKEHYTALESIKILVPPRDQQGFISILDSTVTSTISERLQINKSASERVRKEARRKNDVSA